LRKKQGSAYVFILALFPFWDIRWTKPKYLLLEEDAYPIELYINGID